MYVTRAKARLSCFEIVESFVKKNLDIAEITGHSLESEQCQSLIVDQTHSVLASGKLYCKKPLMVKQLFYVIHRTIYLSVQSAIVRNFSSMSMLGKNIILICPLVLFA